MIVLEHARRARDLLRAQIRTGSPPQPPSWSRGVGIGQYRSGSYFVIIMVRDITMEIQRLVPWQIEGVPIRIEAVGDVTIQGEEDNSCIASAATS